MTYGSASFTGFRAQDNICLTTASTSCVSKYNDVFIATSQTGFNIYNVVGIWGMSTGQNTVGTDAGVQPLINAFYNVGVISKR